MAELTNALRNTRNNISTGVSGFSVAFYKVFWKWLQYIVLGAIHEIFEDKKTAHFTKIRHHLSSSQGRKGRKIPNQLETFDPLKNIL